MKKVSLPVFLAFALLTELLSGCAPISIPLTFMPEPTSISSPGTETAPAAGLNVIPDIQKFLADHKVPYTVGVDGSATIDLADTSIKEKITVERISVTQTNDGLAKEILTGYNKEDSSRVVFVENYGWVKDINIGTPENLTPIPFEYVETGVLNTLASLHYQENPTIPAGAIDPQYWLQGGGSKEVGGYAGMLSPIPVDNSKEIIFTRSTKPYGAPTLWLEFSKDGQNFVTIVQPAKNPSPENKKQIINFNWTFDKDRFDQKGENVDDLVDYFLNDRVSFQALFAADQSRSTPFNRFTYLIGPDGVFSTPNLQKPGELMSLFTPQEQAALILNWEKRALIPWGDIPSSEADIRVAVLPPQLALKLLTADYTHFPWGDIQP